MGDDALSQRSVGAAVILRFLLLIVVLLVVLLLPAGTFAYWQAWVYMAFLLAPMVVVVLYLLRQDPALLKRRLQHRERSTEQRAIIALAGVVFLAIYIIPGLDRRWGWSQVPVGITLAADLLVLLGYLFVGWVFRENSFASRTVEVSTTQRVISTGPYALVRHPMYLGIAAIYLATPLALGSFWGVLAALLIIPVLASRIVAEEGLLLAELSGYSEYTRRTRYRLLPGIW